jgi:hypothetical protein
MRFSNGVLAVSLVLGTLALPAMAGTKTVGSDKSACTVSQKCPAKLSVDQASKAKDPKLTTRAAHPRR